MRDEEVEELMVGKGKGGQMVLVGEEGSRAHVVRRDRAYATGYE